MIFMYVYVSCNMYTYIYVYILRMYKVLLIKNTIVFHSLYCYYTSELPRIYIYAYFCIQYMNVRIHVWTSEPFGNIYFNTISLICSNHHILRVIRITQLTQQWLKNLLEPTGIPGNAKKLRHTLNEISALKFIVFLPLL